jgi:hypothetical protein
MVEATESAPRELGSPRRAGLKCMLMSVERACVSEVNSRDDPVTPMTSWFCRWMVALASHSF